MEVLLGLPTKCITKTCQQLSHKNKPINYPALDMLKICIY